MAWFMWFASLVLTAINAVRLMRLGESYPRVANLVFTALVFIYYSAYLRKRRSTT